MKVKIIQFLDKRMILSEEQLDIQGILCRQTDHIDIFPKDSLLVFNCEEDLISSLLYNKKALAMAIKLYLKY